MTDWNHRCNEYNEAQIDALVRQTLGDRALLTKVTYDMEAEGFTVQFHEDLVTLVMPDNKFNQNDKAAALYRIREAVEIHARKYVECEYKPINEWDYKEDCLADAADMRRDQMRDDRMEKGA